MEGGRASRALAVLAAVSVLGGVAVMTAKPVAVRASTPTPGIVSTYVGGSSTGYANSIDQSPYGLAVFGTTLYVSSVSDAHVRAIDTTTGIESIYAGTGLTNSTGDGGPATAATLAAPKGLAVDGAGDLFIATTDRIRMVTPGGIISTVAGGNPAGCTLPCAATSATLLAPWAVSVDGSGDLFIVDRQAGMVFKVAGGVMSKFAGTATAGFGGDGGPATSAQFQAPEGVAADSAGDVWISDTGNSRIRRVDHSTGLIDTVAGGATSGPPCGNGTATSQSLFLPQGISMDAGGNLLIADTQNNCVRSLSGTTLTTLAQNVGLPLDAAADGSGNVYSAEQYGPSHVDKISGGTVTWYAGYDNTHCAVYGLGGLATNSMLCQPYHLAYDHQGNLYFSDIKAQRVLKVDASTGMLTNVAGNGAIGFAGDGGPATAATFNGPSGIAFNSADDLFISDSGNFRVRRVDHTTGNIDTVAGNGTQGFSGDGGPALAAEFGSPQGLAFDSHDNLYLADLNNYRVRKVDPGGTITTFAGCGSVCQVGSPTSGPAMSVYLNGVFDLASDSADNVYITQTGPVDRVDPAGNLTPFGNLFNSFGVAVGPQNRVVMTTGAQAFLLLPAAPSVTLAGLPQGTTGPTADGSPASATMFNTLYGVAVDSASDIFVAETFNRRVRRIQAYTAPSAPAMVGGVGGNRSATVQWTAPASNGGLPITQYSVVPYLASVPRPAVVVNGSTTSTLVSPLINGDPYTFTVSASNGWASGPQSASSPPVIPVITAPGGLTTIAGGTGSGPPGSTGQDVLSVAANFGDVYFGDFSNPVIRKLESPTLESVVAGNDGFGYSGDGGPATAGAIEGAGAIADCGFNGIYFADTYNFVIRSFSPGGLIDTVVGTGEPGYSDGGGDPRKAEIGRVFGIACRTGGGLYIADSDNGAIRIWYPNNTIATWWSGFSFPTGIVELGGVTDDVAVSDDGSDNAVWELTDTVAGVIAGAPGHPGNSGDGGPSYLSRLNDPLGLTEFGCCGSFSLYIADTGNNRIREVDSSTGLITAFAGSGVAGYLDGPGTTARFNAPAGIAIGGASGLTMYISDTGNHLVRETTISNGPQRLVGTTAGNGTLSLAGDQGPATAAQLGAPYAIAFDPSGNAYIADNLDDVIRKIDLNGTISTVAGNGTPGFSGDHLQATAAQLDDPRGVAVDSTGDIFISDTGNQRIREVDSSGVITTIAGTGVAGYAGDNGLATGARINYPRAVAVDGSGNVYIADSVNNRVRKITPGGIITTVAGNGVAGFSGDGLATSVSLNLPRGLAFDASGHLLIADSANNRVRILNGTLLQTFAGTGIAGPTGDGGPALAAELDTPFGLAVDGASNVYIADSGNQRIRVVAPNGVIYTVIGICGGRSGFRGDGGLAATAEVNFPFGLAADPAGDVYISDTANNRIRAGFGLAGASRPPACQSAPPSSRQARFDESGGRQTARLAARPLAGHFRIPDVHSTLHFDANPAALSGRAFKPILSAPPTTDSSGHLAAPAATHGPLARRVAGSARPTDIDLYPGLIVPLALVAAVAGWSLRRRRQRAPRTKA